MEHIEISFSRSRDEFARAYRKYLLVSKKIKKTNIALICIAFPVAAVYFFLSGFDPLSIVFLAFDGLAAGVLAYLYFMFPVRVFKKNVELAMENKITFTAADFIVGIGAEQRQLTWSEFPEVWESREAYLFMKSDEMFLLVPKRAFGGEKTLKAFGKMLAANNRKTVKI